MWNVKKIIFKKAKEDKTMEFLAEIGYFGHLTLGPALYTAC